MTGRRDRRTSRGDSTTTDGCRGTDATALRGADTGPVGTSRPGSALGVRSISQMAFSIASRADNASSSAISNMLPAARPWAPPSAARTVARVTARSVAAARAVVNAATCSLTPRPFPPLLPTDTGTPFPADAEVAGQDRFRGTGRGPLDQLGDLFLVQRRFPAPVGGRVVAARAMPSRCLSRSKARSNSANAPVTDSSRVAIGVSSPGEDELLLHELHPHVRGPPPPKVPFSNKPCTNCSTSADGHRPRLRSYTLAVSAPPMACGNTSQDQLIYLGNPASRRHLGRRDGRQPTRRPLCV